MSHVHFMRHGETDYDTFPRRLKGWSIDEPLNSAGIEQVRAALGTLPTGFKALYSSPLRRTLMSAHIIAESTHMQVSVRDELKGKHFGSLAGNSWGDVENGAVLSEADRTESYDYRPYGGESVDEVLARLERFLQEVRNSGYDTVLAVTSGGIIRLAYKRIYGTVGVITKNASIHSFEV